MMHEAVRRGASVLAHQHGGHAKRSGGGEVHRPVLEEGGLGGRHVVGVEEGGEGARVGLGDQSGGLGVEDIVEMVRDAEPLQHPFRVPGLEPLVKTRR